MLHLKDQVRIEKERAVETATIRLMNMKVGGTENEIGCRLRMGAVVKLIATEEEDRGKKRRF